LPANRLADIVVESSVNRSRYDGLNIGVRKRLSRRMTLQTSYTLSKAVGYGGASGEFGATARYDQFKYLDPRELAPTVRDERHRLMFSGVIDLPGGLQISPILQFASPRPYTLNAGTDVNRDGVNPSGTAATIQGADVCVAGTAASNGRACPQNVGINSERGGYDLDGNWQSGRFFLLDLRASKYFSLGRVREGMSIGLFFETFNLTNRVNFGNRFTPSVRSSSFMTTAGLATTTYGITAAAPFQAQAGFRFTF
jgi:hypothetical protein